MGWWIRALKVFKTYLSVSNNLWEQQVLSTPIIFGNSLRVIPVAHFIDDFNLSTLKLNSFTFALLQWVILHQHLMELIKIYHKPFTVPFEKSKISSFNISRIKKYFVFPAWFKLPSKLIMFYCFCITVKWFCSFKSIAVYIVINRFR